MKISNYHIEKFDEGGYEDWDDYLNDNNLNYDDITDNQYIDNSFISKFMLYHHLDKDKIKKEKILFI